MSPLATAAWALPAMLPGWPGPPRLTNHCRLTNGSTTELQRWQCPTEWRWSATFSSRPNCSSSSITFPRAWKRSVPAYFPAAAVRFPSKPITLKTSKPWRSPISKSTGSWAGVTFSAPVPNPRSIASSPTTGMGRSMMGSMAFLPTISLYLSSSGCTATPVSPNMVSGRVVATVTNDCGSSSIG